MVGICLHENIVMTSLCTCQYLGQGCNVIFVVVVVVEEEEKEAKIRALQQEFPNSGLLRFSLARNICGFEIEDQSHARYFRNI